MVNNIYWDKITSYIHSLKIDKPVNSIFKLVNLYKIKATFYFNRDNIPLILVNIMLIKIDFLTENIIINLSDYHLSKLLNVVNIANIECMVKSGHDKLSRILKFTLNRQKYIIENLELSLYGLDIKLNNILVLK